MPHGGVQVVEAQPIEGKRPKTGRSRVKPRQLSQILRQCIVEQFLATHSTEDIAEELGLPARTISDVIAFEALRRLMNPQPAGLRRVA